MDLRYSRSLTALRIIMRWRVDGGGTKVDEGGTKVDGGGTKG